MMTRTMFALSFGFVALILVTQNAHAAQNCAPRDVVLEELAGKYGESRRGLGLAANKAMMEIFASTETGTWTLTVTLPDGLTCLVASGDGFEMIKDDLPPAGDPA